VNAVMKFRVPQNTLGLHKILGVPCLPEDLLRYLVRAFNSFSESCSAPRFVTPLVIFLFSVI
jgi:hypothetical protein